MAALVWVRQKVYMCEICGRVMEIGEPYSGRCTNCGSDFCRNCHGEDGVCVFCMHSALSLAGPSLVPG